MSCTRIQIHDRQLPLRQPDGWKVRYPRWMVELPQSVDEIFITYVGVQPRHAAPPPKGSYDDLHAHVATAAQRQAAAHIETWIRHESGNLSPRLWEKFYVETGYDVPDTEVWVMYWTDRATGTAALETLNLAAMGQKSLSDPVVGLWRESFCVPKTRFETVYSGNDYQPGIAALEGAVQVTHGFTGYWGAARDRIPDSAEDDFMPNDRPPVPDFEKDTKGRALSGRNRDVLLHIRSGQWWGRCLEDERKAYEENLEPLLRKGMAYLEDNAIQSGDFGLRFMRQLVSNRHVQLEEASNANDDSDTDATTTTPASSNILDCDSPRRRLETCSAGFFRSLKDLEHWASKHQTHHKIFHGAHAHSTLFGKETFKMRTWHEVAILKPGEVSFEYVNCEPRTGLLPFMNLEA